MEKRGLVGPQLRKRNLLTLGLSSLNVRKVCVREEEKKNKKALQDLFALRCFCVGLRDFCATRARCGTRFAFQNGGDDRGGSRYRNL
jgi:hypothetical protein